MKPGMIGHKKGRRNVFRRKNDLSNRPVPNAPITVIEASASGNVLTVKYNQHVNVTGLPRYTTDVAGAEPVGVAAIGPNEVAITYSDSVAAATTMSIPARDTGIRNLSGGFVHTSTFPLAA